MFEGFESKALKVYQIFSESLINFHFWVWASSRKSGHNILIKTQAINSSLVLYDQNARKPV